jgi:hypothetical protein
MQNLLNLKNLQGLHKSQGLTREQQLFNFIVGLSGLVAYYPLNENSGNAVNNAPATLGSYEGVATGVAYAQPGLAGSAYGFDGVNDDVEVNEIDDVDNASAISIFGLIKPSDTGTKGYFGFRNGDANDSLYLLGLNNTNVEVRFRNSAGGATTLAVPVADHANKWTLFVIVWENDTLTTYVNGTSVISDATSGSFGTSEHDFYIGRDDDTGRRVTGLIQHVGILNRGLTSNEITKLAQITGLA